MQLPLPIYDENYGVTRANASSDSTWRPIHYLGSKLRVLDSVRAALNIVEPNNLPVCDLFSGSGTVSMALSGERDVTAVDVQEYARVICSALLRPAELDPEDIILKARLATRSSMRDGLAWAATPLIEHEAQSFQRARSNEMEPLCELIENGSVVTHQFEKPLCHLSDSFGKAIKSTIFRLSKIGLIDSSRSVIFRHFGGAYFSYKQAVEIDVLLDVIEKEISSSAKDTALAILLSTASEIVNTVGKQFAQPLRPRDSAGKPKRTLFSLASRDRLKDTFEIFLRFSKKYSELPKTSRPHKVVRQECFEFLENDQSKFGVIYADPPYTRDHYSRFYHVLETLCLRDNPSISTNKVNGSVRLSRGIYRQDRYQSPFCIRSQAPSAFLKMFAAASNRQIPLVLSYSPYSAEKNAHPRVMTIDLISDLAKPYFTKIEIISGGEIFHSRLNKTLLNKEISYEAEMLFMFTP